MNSKAITTWRWTVLLNRRPGAKSADSNETDVQRKGTFLKEAKAHHSFRYEEQSTADHRQYFKVVPDTESSLHMPTTDHLRALAFVAPFIGAGVSPARRSAPRYVRAQPHVTTHRRYRINLSSRSPSPSPISSTTASADPDPVPPSLPASSRAALVWAFALAGGALAIPFSLALQDSLSKGLPFWPQLMDVYGSHLLIVLFTFSFGALHSGLASLRPVVTTFTGERLYRIFFALASLPSAGALIAYFIAHRYDGAQLWRVQGVPGVHDAVYVITFISFLLLYPATFNLLEVAAVTKPGFRMYETGITRITRHPQLWGQVLWCVAHTAWIGTSFTLVASLCLVAHHSFGAWNGDRRQRDKFGQEWAELAKRTSIVPFVAVLEEKQKLRATEFLRPAYLGVIAFVLGAYAAHPFMLRIIGNSHI